MDYKRIIELLQQRAELSQQRAALATADTLRIGDDPKRMIELPVDHLVAVVTEAIDIEVRRIDTQLLQLGVTLT